MNFYKFGTDHSLGLKCDLIRFWWSTVNVTVASQANYFVNMTQYLRNTLRESFHI